MSNIALLEQTVKNIVSPGFRLSIKYNDPVVFQEYGSRYQETIESHNIYIIINQPYHPFHLISDFEMCW